MCYAAVPPCDPSPCGPGALCSAVGESAVCACPAGTSGDAAGLAAGPSAWSALNARAIVPACATAVSTLASALVGMAPSAACSTMRLSAPAHHPPPATPSLTVDLEVIYLQQMK